MDSRGRRHAYALVAGLTLVASAALVSVWKIATTSQNLGDGPAPGMTARAVRQAQIIGTFPDLGPQPPVNTSSPRQAIEVSVMVGGAGAVRRSDRTATPFMPSSFWPSSSEAPLPATASTVTLQRLLDAEQAGDTHAIDKLESAFLDAARVQGLHPGISVDDPWAALMAVEASRRRAAKRWMTEMESWGGARTGGPPMPAKQLGPALELSQRIIDAWPDAAVRGYAEIYLMEVLATRRADVYDPKTAAELALAHLRTSTDPVLGAQAVRALTRLDTYELANDDLDALRQGASVLDDPNAKVSLATLAQDAAFRASDLETAMHWIVFEEKVLDGACQDPASCAVFREDLLAARAQAVGLGAGAPTRWTVALQASVWRCYTRHGAEVGVDRPLRAVHGYGTFEDADWSWTRWIPGPDPLTQCLEDAATEPPRPPDGQQVVLRVTIRG